MVVCKQISTCMHALAGFFVLKYKWFGLWNYNNFTNTRAVQGINLTSNQSIFLCAPKEKTRSKVRRHRITQYIEICKLYVSR